MEGVQLLHGDCLELLKTLPENSIDSVVTDPPYHLTSIVKRFGGEGAAPAQFGKDGAYARASRGFMGKTWDGGDVAFRSETWAEVLRVLKPGGHLLAFGGTRTFARMSVAIEDAGFEIRDTLMYLYGVGFPKSHSVNKKLANETCSCQSPTKCGLRPVRNSDVSTALNAGEERRQVLQSGLPQQGASVTGRSQSSDNDGAAQSGLEGWGDLSEAGGQLRQRQIREVPRSSKTNGASGRLCDGTSPRDGDVGWPSIDAGGMRPPPRPQAAKQCSDESGTLAMQPQPQERGVWENCGRCGKPILPDELGTALKPAVEPIVMARKPLSESTVAANVLRWGTGAINVGACRIESVDNLQRKASFGKNLNDGWRRPWMDDPAMVAAFNERKKSRLEATPGRWPANVCHDGSYEVVGAFPHTASGDLLPHHRSIGKSQIGTFDIRDRTGEVRQTYGDSGSAARFFYSAKASKADRAGSKHPTVKPVALMRWLVRMVTPPGGVVLDLFAGSGTTGAAAMAEGFRCVLIEREKEYFEDIQRRLASGNESESHSRPRPAGGGHLDYGPLFATVAGPSAV
jgi:DNA modification methylase